MKKARRTISKKVGAGGSRGVRTIARRGMMFVLSSPSGAGKTTLSHLLRDHDRSIELSVSVTTRAQRRGEIDGKHYHFIDAARFDAMVHGKRLLEWAEVFGNRYGTPRAPVEKALRRGRDVLFDLDWQGTQQLSENARADLVSVFILPPTASSLTKRLRMRAQDTKAIIASRMAKASDELSHWPEYDYVIVNDDLKESLARLVAILAAERLKRERQTGLSSFVRNLRSQL